jgi:hypothetical protein
MSVRERTASAPWLNEPEDAGRDEAGDDEDDDVGRAVGAH